MRLEALHLSDPRQMPPATSRVFQSVGDLPKLLSVRALLFQRLIREKGDETVLGCPENERSRTRRRGTFLKNR